MLVVRSAFVMCLFLLAACADPMGHTDGIWPSAGSAQLTNLSIQTIAHEGAYGARANPGGSGPRAADVIQRYQTRSVGQAPVAQTGLPLQ